MLTIDFLKLINKLKYEVIFFFCFFLINSNITQAQKIPVHIKPLFFNENKNSYQERIPWAVKKYKKIDWIKEFKYLEKIRSKFYEKKSPKRVHSNNFLSKKDIRKNDELIRKIILFNNAMRKKVR